MIEQIMKKMSIPTVLMEPFLIKFNKNTIPKIIKKTRSPNNIEFDAKGCFKVKVKSMPKLINNQCANWYQTKS